MLLKDAIEKIIGKTRKKITYSDIARALSVSRQYVHQIKDKPLNSEQCQKLENFFKVKLTSSIRNSSENDFDEDCITLEHIHINPSCGSGTAILYDPEITPIKLGTQLIKDILKVSSPENLKIFKAAGDSMSPTIEDGDILLVDMGRTNFSNGGIFLLTINNEWYIKRLRLKINGVLEIISENVEKYGAPEIIQPFDDIEIIVKGRVIKNLSRGL